METTFATTQSCFLAGDRLLLERETSSNKELFQESQRRFLCLVIQFSFLGVVQ